MSGVGLVPGFSTHTRRQQVLLRLEHSKGEWVDGPDLANADVGGSEGLKRLRELRAEGYTIEMRRHPNPDRAVWQYRLIDKPSVMPRGAEQKAITEPDEPAGPHYTEPPKQIRFGETVACNRCHGTGKDPYRAPRKCIRCKGIGFLPFPG